MAQQRRDSMYVSNMGGVWRLSRRAYRRLMRAIADGESFDLDTYGKMVVTSIDNDVTDMEPDEARAVLEAHLESERSRR